MPFKALKKYSEPHWTCMLFLWPYWPPQGFRDGFCAESLAGYFMDLCLFVFKSLCLLDPKGLVCHRQGD